MKYFLYIFLMFMVSCSYTVKLEDGRVVELKRTEYTYQGIVELERIKTREEKGFFSCSVEKRKFGPYYSILHDRVAVGYRNYTYHGQREEHREWYKRTYQNKYKHNTKNREILSSIETKEFYVTTYSGLCKTDE